MKQQFLQQSFPTYMHLAQIMEEKTDLEKDTFGKMQFTEIKEMGKDDDMISSLLKIYT